MQHDNISSPKKPTLTPEKAKWILVICALYLISPLDFLPDVIPLIGQVDDLGAFMFAVSAAWTAGKQQGGVQA